MSGKKSSKSKGARDDMDRLQRIIENISDVLVEIDSEMIFSYVSPQITKIFGFGPEEVVGTSVLDFIHPEDLESAIERINIAADGDNVIKFEFRTLHKDGHYVHVSSSGRMIEEGGDLKFVGVINDISERKSAQEDLRKSEEKWRSITETTPDIVLVLDLEGTIVYINHVVSGLEEKDVIGKSQYDFILPEYQALVRKTINNVIKTGKPDSYVIQGVGPDGRTSWYETNVGTLMDGKEINALVLFVHDFTERMEAEEALRASEEKYRTIVESVNDIMYIHDFKGKIIDVNTNACKMLGYKYSELVGKKLDLIACEEERKLIRSRMKDLIRKGKLVFEGEHVTKKGHHIPVSISARVVSKEGEGIVQSFVRDISDLKESEEKFRLISENTSDIIALTDLNGTFIYLSPSIERFGYKVKDLLGKPGFDFIHPDDIEKLMTLLDNAINSTSDETRDIIEYRFRDKAGGWQELESTATLIKDKPGRSGGITFISRDITDRNRLVNDLKEKSDFLDSVVNNISEGIFVLDEDFKYVFINPASGRIMDHDPKEWLGKRAGSNLHPDDGEKSLGAVLQALEEGNSRCEIRVKSSDGKYHDLDMKYSRMMWKDEIHLLGVVNDITESKEVDNVLKESEAKYSAVVENSKDAISIVQDGLIKFANSATVELTGYNFEDLIGHEFMNFVSPEYNDVILQRYKDRLAGKEVPSVYEMEILRKDGSRVQIEVSNTIITYEGQEATMSVIRDTSERKKAEDALRDSEEKYRNIFDLSPEAIMLVSLDGTILDCNNATTSLIGIKKAELIGTSFIKMGLIFEEDVSKYMNIFSQALKEEQMNPFELKLDPGEGMIRWIEMFPTVLKKDGKTNAIQIIARDITERKRTELEMKRRFLSFDMEEGNVYLVQESHLSQSLKAFKELLEVGYPGLVISRTPLKNFRLDTDRPFSHIWLSEKEGKKSIPPRLKEIEDLIYAQSRGQAILIDGMAYLLSKRGFAKCLSCVQSIMETVHLNDHITLLSIDPLTLSEKELRLLQKETVEIAPQMSMGKMPEKLLEVLRVVYESNLGGRTPSYSDIGLETGLSKPTIRNRLRKLGAIGCVKEAVKGRNKYLEITEKGKTYMVLK